MDGIIQQSCELLTNIARWKFEQEVIGCLCTDPRPDACGCSVNIKSCYCPCHCFRPGFTGCPECYPGGKDDCAVCHGTMEIEYQE